MCFVVLVIFTSVLWLWLNHRDVIIIHLNGFQRWWREISFVPDPLRSYVPLRQWNGRNWGQNGTVQTQLITTVCQISIMFPARSVWNPTGCSKVGTIKLILKFNWAERSFEVSCTYHICLHLYLDFHLSTWTSLDIWKQMV